MLDFLLKYEPIWLFILLLAEMVVSLLIYRMARIEFEYDREWNERKAARRKRAIQPKVVVIGTDIVPKTDAGTS